MYPAKFARDRKDGGFVVTFRDLPEAITQAGSMPQCLDAAAGALQAAVAGRIVDSLGIPVASRARRVELVRRLRINEKEARRMLDPHHATKAARMEQALGVLGRHAELRVA